MYAIDLTLSDVEDTCRSAKRPRCGSVDDDVVEVLDTLKAAAQPASNHHSALSEGEDLVIARATGEVDEIFTAVRHSC